MDIKKDLHHLTDEVSGLKNEIGLMSSPKSSDQTEVKERVVRAVTKELKDLWQQNTSAIKQINTRVTTVIHDFDAAQVKCEEIDQSIRKMKSDLQKYYNSAFFREDGNLIKEIHSRVCPRRSSPGEEPFITQSPDKPVQTAQEALEEFRSRITEHPQPPDLVEATTRRHSDPGSSEGRPQQLQLSESRRSCGFSMTTAVEMLPLPSVAPPSTEPQAQSSAAQEASSVGPTVGRPAFKTALITDSIMRHIGNMDENEALGQNHILEVINKRGTSGLFHRDLKRKLEHLHPSFIYIHLGVNDMMDHRRPEEIIKDIRVFKAYADRKFPGNKIFISLPLRTRRAGPRHDRVNEDIMLLRDALKDYINSLSPQDRPLKDCSILMNVNENMGDDGGLSPVNCSHDNVHLSTTGETKILGNFRHHIHELTRRLLNRPPKTRSSRRR